MVWKCLRVCKNCGVKIGKGSKRCRQCQMRINSNRGNRVSCSRLCERGEKCVPDEDKCPRR